MKIIRNYILQECISPFFLALGVLTCMFLLGNLIQLAHLVINKGVALSTVGYVFILYIPVLLGYTLPLACLIGIILALNRLSADNEIMAMRTNGVYLHQLLWPLAVVGLILSLVLFILNDRVIPEAYYTQKQVLKSLGSKNPTALLEPGVFIRAFEGQIIFIHKVEENRMYGVTIYQPQVDRPTRTIIARSGEFTPVPKEDKIVLKLMQGSSDEPDLKNSNNFYKLNFENFFMTLNLDKKEKEADKRPKSMSLKELVEQRQQLQKLLVDTSALETEYYRKIAWSFSPFLFIILGFPLAVVTNKRTKSANVLMAVILAASYYLSSLGCEAIGLQGFIPASVIMWLPDLMLGVIAVYLNIKVFRI